MNVLTVPRTAAALEYKVLRLPATVVETQLVARFLDEESRVRLAYEKALGNVDAAVGRLLDDEALTRRGTALSRRAEVLENAVALEEKAAQRKAEADEALRAQKAQAADQRRTAEKEKAAEARRVREQAAAEKRRVKEQAAAQEKAAAQEISANAEAQLRAERDRLAQAEQQIEQRVAERTAAPKAQLDRAVELQGEADDERAQAERLAQLADAERESRQAQA
jgi:hypothetical protein